jgi:2'-5' RNA ligase
MAEESERARLFVALELPVAVRAELVRWRQTPALRELSGLRMVPDGGLHVTLCFLGSLPASEIGAILKACRVVASEPACPLSLGEAAWLPSRRPRVLAVDLLDRSETLARVQAALSAALQRGGWYVPEARPFRAHVTVARVRADARVRAAPLDGPPSLDFEGTRVTLFRSRLGGGGARYEALGTVALGSSALPLDGVAALRAFHEALSRIYAGGDVSELRPRLTEDVVWRVPGASRIAGVHRGIDAVAEYFKTRREMTDGTFRVHVHGMAQIADRVVQLAGGEALRDGRRVKWETVGVFRVIEGRIAECLLLPFDQQAFDDAWS